MKYNFDNLKSRLNTGSIKWDVKENELPMWVADMDFETSAPIKNAILEKAKLGIYGYVDVENERYDAYINFWHDYYNLDFKKENLMFVTGVVPCISSTVRKITNIHDNVVVLSPTYNIFYNSIINNDRNVLEVPLIYENQSYKIDFEGLEKAFALKNTTLFILCNPQNPVSRIRSKDELEKIGMLAKKYGVIVLSDEIHSQIIRPGKSFYPFASINDTNKNISITAISPTKTFNIAGIHTACILVFNKDLYRKVNRQINTDEVAEPNIFSTTAAINAFNNSRDYLEELKSYLFTNIDYSYDFIEKNIPSLKVIKGDATYLLWVDISSLKADSDTFAKYLRDETGLIISSGSIYRGNGNQFIRINLATSLERVKDGLNRLKIGTENFAKTH